ncbi:hypothetical protein JVU11DRAFT_3116 [Chiua virens]|nr:hypothetical protein JVU11DRAFT_3116 [Chiua virens]
MVEPPSTTSPSFTRSRRTSWLWPAHQKMPSRDLALLQRDPVLPSPREDAKEQEPLNDSQPSAPPPQHGSHIPSRPSILRRPSTSSSISQLLSFQSSSRPSSSNLRPSTSDGIRQVSQLFSTSNGSAAQPAVSARPEISARTTGSFGKMAFNSMIGGLTSLSLSRTSTANEDKDKEKEPRGRKPRSSSFGFPAGSKDKDKDKDKDSASLLSKESSRARSHSPFALRNFRSRDQSPAPLPLEESDSESIISRRSVAVRPQTAFSDDGDSGSECAGEDTEDEEDDWSDDGGALDFVTERNTEQNAHIAVMGGSW